MTQYVVEYNVKGILTQITSEKNDMKIKKLMTKCDYADLINIEFAEHHIVPYKNKYKHILRLNGKWQAIIQAENMSNAEKITKERLKTADFGELQDKEINIEYIWILR